jgi:tetratricopeptide (TPR) repeat protein
VSTRTSYVTYRTTVACFSLLALVFLIESPVLGAASATLSQTRFDSILYLINSGQFDSAAVEIRQLRKEAPEDPEYYVLSYNYFVWRSMPDSAITSFLASNGDSNLTARDSTILENMVHRGRRLESYDIDSLEKGLQILRRGLDLYPDRLDMRFGIVYATASAGLYSEMTDALIGILERRRVNESKWLWSFSQPLDQDPDSFVLENVQSRVFGLWQIGSASTDSLLALIAEALIQTYPTSVYGYTTLGNSYTVKGDYGKALGLLSKAHELDSGDGIVINDLADLYRRMGDTANAIKYFTLLDQIGTVEEKEIAKKSLKELRQ